MSKDNKIIERIRKGDIGQFESLFRSSYVILVRYAMTIIKDHDTAEEIVQDLFVKIWQEREKINIESSLNGYLFRAVHNRCLHYIEHKKVVDRHVSEMLYKPEEKPENPRSQYAVPGLYIFNNEVVNISKNLKPSPRGELEITDVNKEYLNRKQLRVEKIGRGIAWLDTGTPEALLQASNFFGVIEDRQGLKVACIEEIAYHKGFINKVQFTDLVNSIPKSLYRSYLEKILKEG